MNNEKLRNSKKKAIDDENGHGLRENEIRLLEGSLDGMVKCFPARWALELTAIVFPSRSNRGTDRGSHSPDEVVHRQEQNL